MASRSKVCNSFVGDDQEIARAQAGSKTLMLPRRISSFEAIGTLSIFFQLGPQ